MNILTSLFKQKITTEEKDLTELFKYNCDIKKKKQEDAKQQELKRVINAANKLYNIIIGKIKAGNITYTAKCSSEIAKHCNELLYEKLPDFNFRSTFYNGRDKNEWEWSLMEYQYHYKRYTVTAEELYKSIQDILETESMYCCPSSNVDRYQIQVCNRLLEERLPNFIFKYHADDLLDDYLLWTWTSAAISKDTPPPYSLIYLQKNEGSEISISV